jgi:hypothetical protein
VTNARWLEGKVELPSELERALRNAGGAPSPLQLRDLASKLSGALAVPLSVPAPAPVLVKSAATVAKPLGSLGAWVVGGILVGAGLSGIAYSWLKPDSSAPVEIHAPSGGQQLALVPQPALPESRNDSGNIVEPPAPAKPAAHVTAGVVPSVKRAAAVASAEPMPAGETEVMLLKRAQQALASDPAQALALTNVHQQRFAGGLLEQEREMIAIEALLRLGRTTAATTRAEQFRARYPGSAHTRRLNALFSEPR